MIRLRRTWGQRRTLTSVDFASAPFAWIVAVAVCAAALVIGGLTR